MPYRNPMYQEMITNAYNNIKSDFSYLLLEGIMSLDAGLTAFKKHCPDDVPLLWSDLCNAAKILGFDCNEQTNTIRVVL